MSAITLHEFKYIRETFPQIQLSDSWGITSSKSEDVIWNIVLAYLNSFSLSDRNELDERLKFLTGHQEVNQSIWKKMKLKEYISLKACNPFFKLDASFSDTELSNLVAKFKERVENYMETDDKQFQDEPKNFRYLEASSKLLSCNIVLISFQHEDHDLVTVFPVRTSTSPQKIYRKHISILDELIFTSRREIPEEKFSFCIPKEIGINKQKQALKEILRDWKMRNNSDENIQEISELPDISENFLTSLLRRYFRKFILSLYESPVTLSELADAGFETDPRKKDSAGKSAFFYALKTEEPQLVFLLYDHAVDAFLQTEASVCSPDPVMVESLLCLKDHLSQLGDDLKNEEVSEKSRRLLRDVSRFNEFQIEICKSVIGIRCKMKGSNYSEEECEVLQRKETVLAILKTYEIYFDSVNEESSLDSDDFSCFKEYCEHKDFFDKLDFSFSVMFFDNLSCLKDRLPLPNNAYMHVETAFLLFLLSIKYLKQHKMRQRFASLCIAFQERKSLKVKMCDFKKILEKSKFSKKIIVDELPETETLQKLSLIKLQFFSSRLQYYLNAATEHNVTDLKSILVVERCLQFFSECFDKTFSSIKKIIYLAFPKDFIDCLQLIHNFVHGIKCRELLYRNNLEKNMELFMDINFDLYPVKTILSIIRSANTHKISNLLLINLRNSVCKALELSNLKDENQLSLTSSTLVIWKSYYDKMLAFLQKELAFLKPKIFISFYDYHGTIMLNIILALENQLKNLKVACSQKDIEQLNGGFWYLETILCCVSESEFSRKNREYLKSLLDKISSRLEDLRLKFVEDESTETSTDRTFAKSEISEKTSPTENEKNQEVGNPKVACIKSSHPSNRSISEFSYSSFRNPIKNSQMEKNYPCLFEEVSTSWGIFLQSNVNPGHTVISKVGSPSGKFIEREIILKKVTKCLYSFKLFLHDTLPCSPRPYFGEFTFKNIKTYCLKLQEIVSSRRNWKFNDPLLLQQKLNVKEPEREITEHHYSQLNPEYPKNKKILEKSERQLHCESSQTFGSTHDSFLGIRSMLQSKEEDKYEHGSSQNKSEMLEDSWNFQSKSVSEQIKIPPVNRFEFERPIKIFEMFEDSLNSNLVDSNPVFGQGELLPDNRFKNRGSQKKFMKRDGSTIDYSNLEPVHRNRVPSNRFEYFLSRVKILKNILIEKHAYIQRLWNEATTSRKRFYVKEKLVQMYLNDSEIQASVEMLLFQFKTILCSKELEQLWKRTTNLLNGTNLRHFLVSEFPSKESLGRLLDPYNLPSELMETMLKLITDESVLDCMQQILEQSGTNFSGFMEIMGSDEEERFNDLREKIRECPHWKQYALLIPFRK